MKCNISCYLTPGVHFATLEKANKYKFSLIEGESYESDDEPDITRQLLESKGLLPVEGTKMLKKFLKEFMKFDTWCHMTPQF